AASRTAPGAELFYRQLPAGLRVPASGAGRQILAAYGAMFVARGVRLPPVVMFPNAAACRAWQSRVPQLRRRIYGHWVDLQVRPMQALLAAEQAARRRGLKIIPRGHGASRRDYAGTVSLWRSRVNPGLRYWVARRRLSPLRAAAIRRMPIGRQVGVILELQTQGMFFSLGESKNILYSVAAPGSSQHIAMLALDVQDTASPELRRILEAHGWFQTVISDTPHFTYLGVPRSQLPSLGLKRVLWGGRPFWVPNLGLPVPPA
ncbi:MAG: hypothetical protein ACRD2F_10440, partial [Terriglobales bacterium]